MKKSRPEQAWTAVANYTRLSAYGTGTPEIELRAAAQPPDIKNSDAYYINSKAGKVREMLFFYFGYNKMT